MQKHKKHHKTNHITHLLDYYPTVSVYEIPDNGMWYFCLELLEEQGNFYNIQGFKTFETSEEAIMEGYGIIESLGFEPRTKKEKLNFTMFKWDRFNNSYIEETVVFDGYDFFKEGC